MDWTYSARDVVPSLELAQFSVGRLPQVSQCTIIFACEIQASGVTQSVNCEVRACLGYYSAQFKALQLKLRLDITFIFF